MTTCWSRKLIQKADFYSNLFLKSFGQYEMDDRLNVTETDRGGVYEMDKQRNRQKNENATEIDIIL